MSANRPSATAIGAAVLRAAHRVIDDAPYVLDDPYALALSGLPNDAVARAAAERIQREFEQHVDAALAADIARALRAAIALRNRYAEDALDRAIDRGVRQYVLLGAGLDSFALRRRDLPADLRIFEVDLPGAQQDKGERLGKLDIDLPANLHFVPADFENETPLEALAKSDFRRDEPVFFSWLGVTGYLSEMAVYATLSDIAFSAPGSEVAFSYGLQADCVAGPGRQIADALMASIAARNEPAANNGFVPQALAMRLRHMGFGQVEDFDVAAADRRYFRDRADGLRAPPMIHMMKARLA